MNQIPVYSIRYYALGHSYLRHGPFNGWRWDDPENGNRGMAASAVDKDYFARFQYYLKEHFNCKIEAAAENIANFERLCVDGMTKEQYMAHELYASIENHLKAFQPNLVTVFLGGGNTPANDYANISVFFDTLFELIRNAVGKEALVIAANHRNDDVGRACREYAEKYGFAYSDNSYLHTHPSVRENPYHAYLQYPEYDEFIEQYAKENGGAKPVEFRTHPGDLGMDAIGKSLYEAAAPLLPSFVAPTLMSEDVWSELCKKEQEDKRVKNEEQACERKPCTAERFDFEKDSEGVLFNGFNTYVKDSFLCGNSAPGTGFSVAHTDLQLKKQYTAFSVKINVRSSALKKEPAFLNVTINTDGGAYQYTAPLSPNELKEYRFDISDVKGTITGFTIAPSIIECNGDVDWIVFE